MAGGAGLDILAIADSEPRAGDSTPGTVLTSAGGVARNVAENLARLDVHTRLLSAVGDDFAGARLLREARECAIDVESVLTIAGARTASYNAFVDARGETLQAVSDMRIFDALGGADFPALATLLAQCQCCVLDSNLAPALIEHIASLCGESTLVCEAVSRSKCRRLLPVLGRVALLKVNRDEAAHLLDSQEQSAAALCERLRARGVAAVLMSLGEGGIYYADEREQLQLPAERVDVVSVNGAGDALLAGVVAARLHGLSLPTQLQWGLRAARLSCASRRAVSERLSCNVLNRETLS